MNIIFILLLVIVTTCIAEPKCKETSIDEECAATEHGAYLKCLRERQRKKRSLGCDNSCENTNSCTDSCDNCDCNSCDGCSYTSSCNNNCCESCCQVHNSCRNNHCCHKVCHASCRTSSCRESCRRTCYDRVKYNSMPPKSSWDGGISSSSANATFVSENKNLHNVTTIIHLNNVVNNTNIIDTPIRINTTNVNNYSIPTTSSNENSQTSQIEESCCTVLSPRQCERTDKFPFVRCFHYRYKMCGHACYSSVIHTYKQQVCQDSSCQQRPVYVPQPNPSCAYSQGWPYVSCGRQQNVNCEGCYGHLFGQQKASCSPFCYDDGYGTGPYYRQGPFYQPAYSPMPPCQMTGTCGNYYGYQTNQFPNYMGGYNTNYMPGMPYAAQGYGNVPFVYPVPNRGAPYPYPPPLPPGMYPPVDVPIYDVENRSRVENATVAGPYRIDEPYIYNQIDYQYNPYPNALDTDNITRYPHIKAEINTNKSTRYAEIKITPPEREENAI